jgi:threonine dehydrogenase-like Zn-dependent dehydrogenase
MPALALSRRAVRFPSALSAELAETPVAVDALQPHQSLVESEATVVSAGTELSIYRGTELWAPLPSEVGYGAVGRVVARGERSPFALGQRVFHYGRHASIEVVDEGVPVPEGLDPARAALAGRMGQVAFTAVRVARPELGDVVAVTGLGLVGQICAQLLRLSGCTVIGVDLSARRRELALALGLDHAIDPAALDPAKAVGELTGGALCRAVVEATGVPGMAATAVRLAGRDGQVILLGTPRGEFAGDATEMLRDVHHAHRNVTLRGAHEWIYPRRAPSGHSLERNIRQLFSLALAGRLRIDELVSHRVAPERCAEVYARLQARDERYVGVIFDWTQA